MRILVVSYGSGYYSRYYTQQCQVGYLVEHSIYGLTNVPVVTYSVGYHSINYMGLTNCEPFNLLALFQDSLEPEMYTRGEPGIFSHVIMT